MHLELLDDSVLLRKLLIAATSQKLFSVIPRPTPSLGVEVLMNSYSAVEYEALAMRGACRTTILEAKGLAARKGSMTHGLNSVLRKVLRLKQVLET